MGKAKAKRAHSTSHATVTKSAGPKRSGAGERLGSVAASGAAAALLAGLPVLTDAERNDLHGQFDDAECRARAADTKAAAVTSLALGWAAQATRTLSDASLAEQIDYALFRLSWLLELVVALQAENARTSDGGNATGVVRTERDLTGQRARKDRARLVDKVGRAVKGNGRLAAAFARTRGEVSTDAGLKGSLEALASLIDTVLTTTPTLAAATKLTAADAELARADAAALSTSRDDVVLGGRAAGGKDSPAQNLLEGRILHELMFLRDAFDAAISRGAAVSALVATPSLQRALAHTHPTKAVAPTPPVTPPAGQPN